MQSVPGFSTSALPEQTHTLRSISPFIETSNPFPIPINLLLPEFQSFNPLGYREQIIEGTSHIVHKKGFVVNCGNNPIGDNIMFENLSSTEFLENATVETIETQPTSAFEISKAESSLLALKATKQATQAKAKIEQLNAEAQTIQSTLTILQPDILKARRDLAVAKKLQRVRNTPKEEIDAMEEALATLEVETDELNDRLDEIQTGIETLASNQKRALLLGRLDGYEFNLGTTRAGLTLQLLSALRRNLVYKQRYLEDTVSTMSSRIRDKAERTNYATGIAGFESEAERDSARLDDLEAELGEVYALQEVTGLLYDKIEPLLPENQQALLQWSPKDQISIQTLRREALEKETEKAEIQAEIAARRAAEKAAIQDAARGRRLRSA